MKISIKLPSGNTVDGSVNKEIVTIGRSNKADFVVNDESLSRIHCQVEMNQSQFYVTDLGSANGVYLDGTRIEANKKTQFSTFMQLMVGPLECTIQDSDQDGLQLDYKDTAKEAPGSSHSTAPSMAPQKKPQPRMSKKVNQEKAKAISPVVLLVTIGVVLTGIYFATKSEDNLDSSAEILESAAPAPIKKIDTKPLVPNEFSSQDLYLSADSKKACSEETPLCSELKLTSIDEEGIFVQGPEIYIFFKPSKLLKQPHLSFLRENPDSQDVLSHFILLSSSLMEKLETREIEQVHLIIIDEQNKMTKVFRYHATKFEPDSNERFDLLESISSSIRAQDIKEVAQVLELKIPSKTF